MPGGIASSCRVYPRVCGGTLFVNRRQFLFDGLSPRVRGNLLIVPAVVVRERSIPACAGEPVKCLAHVPHT